MTGNHIRLSPEPVEHIAENLQIYGFPEAAARINELLATSEGRQAYEDYGVPLVGADLQDFKARLELQRRAMPAIEQAISSPDFAGVRVNHQRHGEIEIYVQNPNGPGSKAILDRVAAEDRPRVSIHPAPHALSDLKATATAVLGKESSDSAVAGLIGLDVDGVTGTISLLVGTEIERERVQREVPDLEARYGNAFSVELGEPIRNHHDSCWTYGRQWCVTPNRAGTEIWPYWESGSCTMGFHVWDNRNGNSNFLSAGHCGAFAPGQSWWHGSPYVGNWLYLGHVQYSLHGGGGYDAMSVMYSPGWAHSNVSYREAPASHVHIVADMAGASLVGGGTTVCKSGISTGWTCAPTLSGWHYYLGEYCGCPLWGVKANYWSATGDSGGPVVLSAVNGENTWAAGIHSGKNSSFAVFAPARESLQAMNLSLRTS